ncbi:TPA: glycosyltransferase family 4 protein [Escherichia coli]|nr:glycosyltransferase family 4 protein [Escherichia coli]
MITIDGIIYNLQSFGGISVYFNELIQGMVKSNYQAEILLYKNKEFEFDTSDLKLQYRKPRILERYRNVSDIKTRVLHTSYYRVHKSPNLNVKNVTTVHDFTYEKYRGGMSKFIHSLQKYHAIKNSDIVICISNNTARDLLKYCPISEDKIRVIYNGVSPSYKHISNMSDMRVNNSVLFVGAREGYKNFVLAVKAVGKLHGLKLTIVGGGSLKKYERELLEKYLKNRYEHFTFLSNEDLNIQYNTAYALVYPSSYEGFGIPVLEAMQAGCPVICANTSSLPEVGGNAPIYIDDINEFTLKEALELVNLKRNVMIERGLLQAQKFSWSKCVNETIKVYNELNI